jgi:hypothetical protein
LAAARRLGASLCLALLDIDNFKSINDRLGHTAGDAALVHLAQVTREVMRPQDLLARYGGEEFVLLLPDTTVAKRRGRHDAPAARADHPLLPARHRKIPHHLQRRGGPAGTTARPAPMPFSGPTKACTWPNARARTASWPPERLEPCRFRPAASRDTPHHDTPATPRLPAACRPGGCGRHPAPLGLEHHPCSHDPFALGVASGDPAPDGVVLWTRLLPTQHGELSCPFTVRWELADDPAFRRIVQRGQATALPALGHSVHVELHRAGPGPLVPLPLHAGRRTSATGRTRTAPRPMPWTAHLRVAFASCQRWEHGHYAAWRHVRNDQPDLVLFLGDYIYEYATPKNTTGLARTHTLRHASTLADFRDRYALHKSDPALQAAHAACPWAVTWDDHEVQNDYAGPRQGQPGRCRGLPGPAQRSLAGVLRKHAPACSQPGGRPTLDRLQVYRRLRWGRLAQVHLLDTRQHRQWQACRKPGRQRAGLPRAPARLRRPGRPRPQPAGPCAGAVAGCGPGRRCTARPHPLERARAANPVLAPPLPLGRGLHRQLGRLPRRPRAPAAVTGSATHRATACCWAATSTKTMSARCSPMPGLTARACRACRQRVLRHLHQLARGHHAGQGGRHRPPQPACAAGALRPAGLRPGRHHPSSTGPPPCGWWTTPCGPTAAHPPWRASWWKTGGRAPY